MKLYFYVLILIIFLSFCIFGNVFAVRVDFLNNTNTLQPPPNVPGSPDVYFDQNNSAKDSSNLQKKSAAQNNSCLGSNCQSKRGSAFFPIGWLLWLFIPVILIAIFILVRRLNI